MCRASQSRARLQVARQRASRPVEGAVRRGIVPLEPTGMCDTMGQTSAGMLNSSAQGTRRGRFPRRSVIHNMLVRHTRSDAPTGSTE